MIFIFIKLSVPLDNLLNILFLLLSCIDRNFSMELCDLSTLSFKRITHIFRFGRSTISAISCNSLSFSSVYLNFVNNCTGDKFSALLKFSPASTALVGSLMKWMKPVSPFVSVCTNLKSMFLTLEGFEFNVQVIGGFSTKKVAQI